MKRIAKLAALTLAISLVPATAMAAKTAAPSALSYPDTVIDKESGPQTITVGIGAGDASARWTTPAVSDCAPGGFCDFRFTTTCPVFPATFAAGNQSCTFSVFFTPYDGGARSRTLDIGNDFPSVALSGKAVFESSKGGKKKKCKKKGKRSASAAKKKCGKKKR